MNLSVSTRTPGTCSSIIYKEAAGHIILLLLLGDATPGQIDREYDGFMDSMDPDGELPYQPSDVRLLMQWLISIGMVARKKTGEFTLSGHARNHHKTYHELCRGCRIRAMARKA